MITAVAGAVYTAFGGAAVGGITAAALSVGVVASYVVAIVVVLAAAALLGKLLAPNLPKSARDTKGIQNVIRSNITPRRIIYGEAVTGGPYLLLETTGTTNQLLNMIVVLSTHPVEDVLGVMIDDQYVDISGNTNGTTNDDSNGLNTNYWVTGGKYGSGRATEHVKIIKNLGWGYADHQYVLDGTATKCVNDRERTTLIGNETQSNWTAASDVRDSATGLYTSSGYKATNCAHIFLQFKFNRDVWSGFPKIKFHVKGKPLYNPYLDANLVSEGADSAGTHDINDPDTWEWSEDWALCTIDYLINKFYGLGAKIDPADILTEVDWSEAIQAYQDSSTLVTNGLPSPNTESTPRYTINGVLETGSTPISNMEALLTSGAGDLIYAQGEYKLRAAVYRSPDSETNIINEDMMVSPLSIRTHTPRADIFNKVSGMFTDKGYDEGSTLSSINKPAFEPTDFGLVDPLDSSGINPYEVVDGEEIIRDFDYPLTTREYEAQRLARIQLEKVRRGMVVSFEATMEALKYSVGDTVYLEILNDSKYANEVFFNKLGLDDAVQDQDSPGTSPYYKQFKILEMQYSANSTINITMREESDAIYDWNDGDANPSENALEAEIIADDPTGEVLVPSFVVNSPYVTIEEIVGVAAGTTVTTLVSWSAAERGSLVEAIDQIHIHYYRLEYGEVTDPSLTGEARVANWVAAGNKVSNHAQVTQGPLPLETLYKDGALYDFRLAAVTYSGRQSDWAYYNEDIGSDYNPTAAAANGARTVSLSADDLAFSYNSSGSSPSPTTTTFTATPYGFGSPEYRFLIDTVEQSPGWSATATYTYTPEADIVGMPEVVTVEAREGSSGPAEASDSQSVVGIRPGVDGTGANAYTVILSNEAHTLSTTAAGVVTYTGSGAEIRVFDGTTELTSAAEPIPSPTDGKFSVVVDTINPSASITPGSITTSGTPAVIADHSSMTEDTVVITYAINIEDAATIYKDQSLAKSQAGDDGITPYYGYIEATNGVAWTQETNGGTWNPAATTTQLDFTVTQDGTIVAQDAYLITRDSAGLLTGSAATHSNSPGDFANSPGSINISTSGSGTQSFTVTFDYTNGAEALSMTETVITSVGADDGADGHSVSLTAPTLAFTYDSDGENPTPANSLVTATGNNFTSPQYRFLVEGVEVQAFSATNTYTYVRQALNSNMPEVVSVEAREGTGAVEATAAITMTGIQPGAQGPTGPSGADGAVGWGHDLVFSSTDADTVEWTGGNIWTAAGTTFPIDSPGSNTGNMTQRTYIYFDGSSPVPTTLSTTTNPQTAVGLDKILIAVAEDTTSDEAFFQVFGGRGGLKVAADEIAANSIVANNINASFYEGRTFTGGIFQTRKLLADLNSPYPDTPRASMSSEYQFQLQNENDDVIFSVVETGGVSQVSIVGDVTAAIDSNIFSATGIDALRDAIGVVISGTSTGGIATRSLPTNLTTPASADYELDIDIYTTALTSNSFTFTIRDSGFREGSSNNPYTAPTWALEFFYSDTGAFAGEEVAIPSSSFSVTGTANTISDPEIPWYTNTFSLNATRQVNWTPASPFAADDTIYYMIRVDITAGDSVAPKLTALTASEAVVGDSLTGTGTDNFIAVWDGTDAIDATDSFLITNAVAKNVAETIAGDWVFTGLHALPPSAGESALTLDRLYLNGKTAVVGSDLFLRINQASDFSNGIVLYGNTTIQSASSVTLDSTVVDIPDGQQLRLVSTNAANLALLSAISTTEFRIQSTNLTDLVFTGWTQAQYFGGMDIQLYASNNVDGANLQVVGNTLNITGIGTFTDVDIAGGIDFSVLAGSINAAASTTSYPSLNIAEGIAPTAPVDGDVWVTAAGEFNARLNGSTVDLAGGSPGTVTSVSVVTNNGVSGSVATPTTTPAITLTLGAITPTSVGGITSANLVDKSTTEQITGLWEFSRAAATSIVLDASNTGAAGMRFQNNNGTRGYLQMDNAGALSTLNSSSVATGFSVSSTGVVSGGNVTSGTDPGHGHTLSGDVTGTLSATVVGNDSHTHTFNNLTSKTSGTGNYETSGRFSGSGASAGAVLSESVSNVNPTLVPNKADLNTGIGWAAADELSLTSGGIEMQRQINDGTTSTRYNLMYYPVYINEKASASNDIGAYGQYWVKNNVPNDAYFTGDTGIDYPIAYARYRCSAATTMDHGNQSLDMTTDSVADALVNGCWWSDNSTAYTLTLEPNTDTQFPVGGQMTVVNQGSGTLTINEGSGGQLFYGNGNGAFTDTAGGMTLAQGGYLTIIRKTTVIWWALGSGGTP